MKSVLDPSFRYTPSYDTDVRKTFERIRRELEAQARRHPRDAAGDLLRQRLARTPAC